MSAAGAGGFDRDVALERLAAETFDVLVVGGGITGAGVALDAASRGLRTALVERDDFGSGTSSRSSKLVHGGLRYLSQGDYGLVAQALAERQRLLGNAPHLVRPLPFIVPAYGSRARMRAVSSALWLYDLAGGFRIGSLHRRLSVADALGHAPALRADGLVGAHLYLDAQADDARLTLAIVRTAVLDHRAVAANYARVTELLGWGGGRVAGARVSAGDASFDVRASVVVVAAGVWADELRGDGERSIRPAKGVHVTLPARLAPTDVALVLTAPADGRSVFVVPWPGADRVYVGTTDTDYDGPLDDPRCTPEDVDYLLGALNAGLSTTVAADDVVGEWAGLRPLVAGGVSGSRSADLSRRHRVGRPTEGLVTISGGKLTTYRAMAEDTVDAVQDALGARRTPCRTRRLALHGTTGRPVTGHLAGRHGTEARVVTALVEADPALGRPLVATLPYLRAEAVYAARYEMARSVDDVLSRRTRSLILDRDASRAAAPDVARLLAPELGWTEAEANESAGAVLRSRGGGLTAVDVVERLRSVCAEVSVEPEVLDGASGDRWTMAAAVAARPLAVARPGTAGEAAAVLAECSAARVPVTPAGGRSGVCGGAIPVHGGIVLDMRGLAGPSQVDDGSLLADVGAGTMGDALEADLREGHGLTLGHRPQSLAISTVGGWLACRSAGQYSTRYGKIEDMVAGLEVALADGRLVRTGGRGPRAAAGPDLNQLFVGSEGTLGVITQARLRLRPAPDTERRAAYRFGTFTAGIDACRRMLRRGATPAVLRLYDAAESAESFSVAGPLLVVLDEGDAGLVDATMDVVASECAAAGADPCGPDPVDSWMAHRDDTRDVAALARQGIYGDTIEVAARWSSLPALHEGVRAAVGEVPGTVWFSCHLSHAYTDGACLYLTVAGQGEGWYVPAWDATAGAVLAAGAVLSHHHGIGLAKARFLPAALDAAHGVLVDVKRILDPAGVLNPGKLGLPDPFGPVGWPPA